MILTMTLLILSGCSLWTPTPIIKHPDAPMLIMKSKGKALVALYDKENNEMIEYGWVKIPEAWTLHKYDWEKILSE